MNPLNNLSNWGSPNRQPAPEFCLVTTEHLEKNLLFKDSEDFRTGMNYVAIVTAKLRINLLAFILMSNHTHFVLEEGKPRAEAFINAFKMLYSKYVRSKHGTREFLRRNGVDIQMLKRQDESLEWGLAYTQMNSVAAKICANSFFYPWGTGSCFFNPSSDRGRPLASLSGRERIRLLHSNYDLPGDWLLGEEGFILPRSFIKVERVEEVFKTPGRMNYFLKNSSKARRRLESTDSNLPSFRDQLVYEGMSDLCHSLFSGKTLAQLLPEERAELVRQIKYRFSSGIEQIARVTGFASEDILRFLG